MESDVWAPLGIALGLGLLVGLQRERAKPHGAGIRTFALISSLGAVCALLANAYGGWVLGSGLLSVAALLVVMNRARAEKDQQAHPGQTTEVAALLMFGAGALLVLGETAAAIAIGGGVAVLLQWKRPLHQFVQRIGEDEIRAVFRLVLIAMVILPVLPNRAYGPYRVLNPFQIWQMVVLIVGISIAGFLASKYLRAAAGSLLSGLLGGLISSTATAVSYARRSQQSPDSTGTAAVVIIVASGIVFVRVTIEVALVAPSILTSTLPQFGVMLGLMGVIAGLAYRVISPAQDVALSASDPTELGAAVVFGGLYAVVLIAVAAAQDLFGDRGLYAVAALSGLTDMDAITLSTARLIEEHQLSVDTGWRMMVVGALANMAFKTAVVAALGSPRLFREVSALFGLALGGGVLVLWLWPSLT